MDWRRISNGRGTPGEIASSDPILDTVIEQSWYFGPSENDTLLACCFCHGFKCKDSRRTRNLERHELPKDTLLSQAAFSLLQLVPCARPLPCHQSSAAHAPSGNITKARPNRDVLTLRITSDLCRSFALTVELRSFVSTPLQ